MSALAVMFGFIGSFLILVSAVGGGITFARARVPRIDPISRILSGAAGSFLIGLALFAAMLSLMFPSAHDLPLPPWFKLTDGPPRSTIVVRQGHGPGQAGAPPSCA